MRAILLAAGMGRRLAAASGGDAKALVRVQGTPLVVHQLRTLQAAGFPQDRLVVVTGCDGERVAENVQAEAPKAVRSHNARYRDQNLLSLLAAREHLGDGFLLVNVDHLMPPSLHQRLLATEGHVVAAVDADRPIGDDDMKVKLDAGGRIAAISKQLTDWDRGYIGMTRVDAAAHHGYMAAADDVLAKVGPERAVVEMVLARLAEVSEPPAVCDCSGLRWAEIDTPEELAAAEQLLADRPDFFDQ